MLLALDLSAALLSVAEQIKHNDRRKMPAFFLTIPRQCSATCSYEDATKITVAWMKYHDTSTTLHSNSIIVRFFLMVKDLVMLTKLNVLLIPLLPLNLSIFKAVDR